MAATTPAGTTPYYYIPNPSRYPAMSALGLFLVILGAGVVLAVALSEGLRNKVLDLLFGAEEEFDYVPTTAPPAASAKAEAPSPADVAATNGKADTVDADAAVDSE